MLYQKYQTVAMGLNTFMNELSVDIHTFMSKSHDKFHTFMNESKDTLSISVIDGH